jgi:hypothetical protein
VGEREIEEEEDVKDAGERKKNREDVWGGREKKVILKKKVKVQTYYFNDIENY